MGRWSRRRAQRGYLLEIPILLFVIVIVASVVLPNLPPIGRKIFLGIAAVPVLFGLYYMIVIPGWTPNAGKRLPPVLRLIAFILVAGLLLAGLVMFFING